MFNVIVLIAGVLALGFGGFAFWQSRRLQGASLKREAGVNQRMYELAILKELGDRVGYSLNVQEIIDIITGSLHQFIDYSAVSYMLLGPEKIIFKVHLEKSVHREFLNNIRDRMLGSLSALLDRPFEKKMIEEIISGAVLVEDVIEPVRSFFNIPLVIGEKVVGVLTIADIKDGLYKEEEMTILYKITQQASKAVTKLQEVVQTEERKLNSMVESMIEGVVMTDRDYRVVVANPTIKSILGLDKQKEPDIFDLIDHLGGVFDIRGKLEESTKLDKILEVPEVMIRDHFFQIFVSPVKNSFGVSKGEILGGVVIFRDITKEKEIIQLRDDFTSMMVHELRSPLEGIKNMTDLMVRKGKMFKPEKFVKEYAPIIFKDSSGMLTLVNSLLDVAKMEAGKLEVKRLPSDIKKIIAERITFYESSAKELQIKLESVLGVDIPAMFLFDPEEIARVLNNLISNALKFTSPGGKVMIQALIHRKEGDLTAEAGKNGIEWFIKQGSGIDLPVDSLVVAVTDAGVGIRAENTPLLFNKFKQFRSAAIKGGKTGTGLGLAIARGIVEAHGGIIGVASEDGRGSTFYFTLPI